AGGGRDEEPGQASKKEKEKEADGRAFRKLSTKEAPRKGKEGEAPRPQPREEEKRQTSTTKEDALLRSIPPFPSASSSPLAGGRPRPRCGVRRPVGRYDRSLPRRRRRLGERRGAPRGRTGLRSGRRRGRRRRAGRRPRRGAYAGGPGGRRAAGVPGRGLTRTGLRVSDGGGSRGFPPASGPPPGR